MGIVNVIKHYGGSVGAHPILIEAELTNISNEGISTGDTKRDLILATECVEQNYLAALFLRGADRNRYGHLKDIL